MKWITSACMARLKSELRTHWTKQWEEDAAGRELYRRIKAPRQARAQFEKYNGLTRAEASIHFQINLGHIGLRKYLKNRHVPGYEDPTCDRCESASHQDVPHILFHCEAYGDLRREELWPDGQRL